jgi:hypothetical protein
MLFFIEACEGCQFLNMVYGSSAVNYHDACRAFPVVLN